MPIQQKLCRLLSVSLLCLPLFSFASHSVKSMVVFGDSLSDTGNTTQLLKSLRQEESPAYIVAPFKAYVLNKMIDFANDYYVPQMVLDSGIDTVTNFFDHDLAPALASLVSKIRLVPILPGKPYWNARFSNGRVWNEYLAQMWSLEKSDGEVFLNKAFGGSWASTYDYQLTVWNLIRHPINMLKTLIVGKLIPPSLGLTVQAYLLEHQQLNSDTVYFVYSGWNDYLSMLLFEDNYNSTYMSNYVDNVVDSLGRSILKLENAGAKRFVIIGIPHIGNTPKYTNTTDRDVLNTAVDMHNQRLLARVNEWSKLYPTADFLFIDTEQSLKRALANPGQYGFTNTTESCISVKFPMFDTFASSPFASNYVLRSAQVMHHKDQNMMANETNYHVCDVPAEHLYWDDVHPSTRAHGFMALDICSAMQEHGYDVACTAPNFDS